MAPTINPGDLVGPVGALMLAIFIVLAFMQGWIVSRRTYDDMRRDRDDWRDVATTSTNAAETAVRVASVARRVRLRRQDADENE